MTRGISVVILLCFVVDVNADLKVQPLHRNLGNTRLALSGIRMPQTQLNAPMHHRGLPFRFPAPKKGYNPLLYPTRRARAAVETVRAAAAAASAGRDDSPDSESVPKAAESTAFSAALPSSSKIDGSNFDTTALTEATAQSVTRQGPRLPAVFLLVLSSLQKWLVTRSASVPFHGRINFAIREWIISVVAGLLSSSCCLLQLIVNLLSAMNVVQMGCAGFNTVLGPLRLPLRMLTVAWLAFTWVQCIRKGCFETQKVKLYIQTSLCLFLTFLPELLLVMGGPAIAAPMDGAEKLVLNVDGMGCEACSMKVKGLLDHANGVLGSHVDFKTGTAELLVNKDWAFNVNDVSKQLTSKGYGVSLPKS